MLMVSSIYFPFHSASFHQSFSLHNSIKTLSFPLTPLPVCLPACKVGRESYLSLSLSF
jgi:hypothetical protein